MSTSEPFDPLLQSRLNACLQRLASLESTVVGFSGGVDSTLLTSLAAETLGPDRVIAAFCASALAGEGEQSRASDLAASIGVEFVAVGVDALASEELVANTPRRCYHCKKVIFQAFLDLARRRGFKSVCSGANADDAGDWRPGMQATAELGIVEPFLEAGLTKDQIRRISRQRGLPTWSQPSMACLASRIPYGEPVTVDKLRQVDQAETVLREAGFRQYRVRHHGRLARIEVPEEELPRALAIRQRLIDALRAIGFAYVTLDLQGFRSGAMNETLGDG